MKAFSVTINGERVALAGLGGQGVLSVMISLLANESQECLDFEIGGLVSSTGSQVLWPSPSIQVGDEITIKIVESETVDQPMD